MNLSDWFRTRRAIIHELERTREELFKTRAELAKADKAHAITEAGLVGRLATTRGELERYRHSGVGPVEDKKHWEVPE